MIFYDIIHIDFILFQFLLKHL